MAITTSLVGALGGAPVRSNTINWTNPGGTGVKDIFEVPIPSGENYVIAIQINLSNNISANSIYSPKLHIGGVDRGYFFSNGGLTHWVGTVPGPTMIQVDVRNTGSNHSANGTYSIFWWKAA